MLRFAIVCFVSVLGLSGTALAADPVIGLWKTERDRKDLISHVQIYACQDKFCGRVEAAFDYEGRQVHTKNVGRALFWDVEALGGGKYGNGTVFVPLLNIKAKASLELSGNKLKVTGCKAGVCDGQVWTRIR